MHQNRKVGMRRFVLISVIVFFGCAPTTGVFLTHEKSGWFNVTEHGTAGMSLYYCKAHDADQNAGPMCYHTRQMDGVPQPGEPERKVACKSAFGFDVPCSK